MNRQGKGKIEYLDYTWSPISGCLHDCSYCYMKRMAARFPQVSMTPTWHGKRLNEPLKVKKPSIIGVVYSGDMWGNWVGNCPIQKVLDVCKQAHWHRFLFLTKNPKRYAELEIPENCWTGTSITGNSNTPNLDRLGWLWHAAPKQRVFLSLEPFISFSTINALNVFDSNLHYMKWLIVGGLTGAHRQTSSEEDLNHIVKEAKRRNTPVFIKSNAGYPEKIQQYPEGLRNEYK